MKIHTQENNMIKPPRIYPGCALTLKANRKEGWKREAVRYVGKSGPTTILVQTVEREEGDDGLREVTWDQVEEHRRPSDEQPSDETKAKKR